MATSATAQCRQCRREGAKLFLKGERCYSRKCAFERRSYAPGQHGQNTRNKVTEYGQQLREKQKMRRIYNVREKQFVAYYHEALRRKGVTGENLLQLIELRLDNAIYRMGFAASRAQARELCSHGHFAVNGKKVNTPSYSLRPGDVVEVREGSKGITPIVQAIEGSSNARIPAWLDVNSEQRKGTITHAPTRDEIDSQVDETLIIEFYSR